MTTVTKDMWVANLLEPWKDDSSSMSVIDFFLNQLMKQPKWED